MLIWNRAQKLLSKKYKYNFLKVFFLLLLEVVMARVDWVKVSKGKEMGIFVKVSIINIKF